MALTLDKVLIRTSHAHTPYASDGLSADAEWRVAGVWRDASGGEHVVELHFASLEEAQVFASSELAISGRWDDPDGDGNYCIVEA